MRYLIKSITILAIALFIITACKKEVKTKNSKSTVEQKEKAISKAQDTLLNNTISKHIGNYVSEDYEKRNKGYDWVAVTVSSEKDDKLKISVCSRADKKKPTCTFSAIAHKVNKNTYKTYKNNIAILFHFNGDQISIDTENKEDSNKLLYYCSGGSSLRGAYKKIEGNLDLSQTVKKLYSKVLYLQNIKFDITLNQKGNSNQLTIKPSGLSINNNKVTHDIDNIVIDAEIEDLNADGFPELLIYTQSVGSGSYGNVIGYSVNNGKSMSQIYFPPISENKKLSKGYMGHDEFAIVETIFVQRFPIYKETDTNANPTGGIRQIEYQLKDGEASRKFVISNVVEY